MSTDLVPLPATNDKPVRLLRERRREPRDLAPSTNPNAPEPRDEPNSDTTAESSTPPLPTSGSPQDAPPSSQASREQADSPRRQSVGRISRSRSKGTGVTLACSEGDRAVAETESKSVIVEGPDKHAVLMRLALTGAGTCIELSNVVLGISMPHLASGVSKITACEFYTAIFMAVVFDLSQVAAEFSVLVMPLLGIASRGQHLVCAFIISACTLVSMTLNVRAFLEHVTTPFETSMAFAWGGLLPILVLLLVFVASSFIMRLHAKPPADAVPSAS